MVNVLAKTVMAISKAQNQVNVVIPKIKTAALKKKVGRIIKDVLSLVSLQGLVNQLALANQRQKATVKIVAMAVTSVVESQRQVVHQQVIQSHVVKALAQLVSLNHSNNG